MGFLQLQSRQQPETPVSQQAVTDTVTQEVQGTLALRTAGRNFARSVLVSSALLFNGVDQPNGPLPAQPDTYTQDVQGTASLTRAAKSRNYRASVAAPLGFFQPEDLTVQPETLLQETQGTASLARATKAFRARNVQTSLGLWNPAEPDGQLPTQADTWTQPIQGTSALSQSAALLKSRVTIAAPLGFFTPEDPGIAQPDTWTQDVQGQTALGLASRTYRQRAAVIVPLEFFAPEDPTLAQPDTWTQETQGTAQIGLAQRWAFARARASHLLTWNLPEDASAPQGVQADPPVQDVQGTASLNRSTLAFAMRATRNSGLWQAPSNPDPPIATAHQLILVQGRLAMQIKGMIYEFLE